MPGLKVSDDVFLLDLCEDSSVLRANPAVSSALAVGNAAKILTHLKEQRELYRALNQHQKECRRNRCCPDYSYMLLAVHHLNIYEQFRRRS